MITPEQTSADQPVSVSATIRNTSDIPGDEVVQLYIHDSVASVAVPVKQLSGFKRISLEPGEEQTVTFTLDESHLALWNEEMNRVVEPGEFEIMVGSSSEDIRLCGTLLVK